MRAIALSARDSGLSLHELAIPQPHDDELLVRVHASSINPIDVLVASGAYRWGTFEFPAVPGWDFAGTVERIGPRVSRHRVGDAVFGYWSKPRFRDGAWAEYLVVAETGMVVAKPPALSFVQAAAMPLAAVTALLAIDAVAPAPGETVLVTGAGGAVGRYAVQLAARAGATVIATAKPAHAARVRALGATHTIDYSREDVAAAAAALAPAGLPVLIDLVNDGAEVAALAAGVRDGGRVASARFAADADALGERGIVVANVAADSADPALLSRLAGLAQTGQLEIDVDELRPLEDLPAAVDDVSRGGRGKVVVVVAPVI
jgi:NADPH:quinone reductase-like Zn-dependent oxidoreductase